MSWTENYTRDTCRLSTARERIGELWQDPSPRGFSWFVTIAGTLITLASLLNLYQPLVWSVGWLAARSKHLPLRWQLNCADLYVTTWLILLLGLLIAGTTTVGLLGPVLAIWRIVDILSTNLRVVLTDVPRIRWETINPRRSLLLIVTNAVEMVVAYAVILSYLAAGSHFSDLSATIQPWEAAYRSAGTMFTLGGGLTPLDQQGESFVIGALASGLILIAIVIASVVASLEHTESPGRNSSVSSTSARETLVPNEAELHERAWKSLSECLAGAFDSPQPSMVKGKRAGDDWTFTAEASGKRYSGTVGVDGRSIHVVREPDPTNG